MVGPVVGKACNDGFGPQRDYFHIISKYLINKETEIEEKKKENS